jgi:GSH-dependent disulfide-bond oxidoreductase
MIDLYGMLSPNVIKIALMLEEIGRPYTMHHVRCLQGENFTPEFLALNPVAKVPVIVDHDKAGVEQPIFESGAILMYLAETYESSLLPTQGPARWEVLKWLMVQVSLAGPMLGQVNHFQGLPGQAGGYASDRYLDQAARVYRIIDDRLGVVPWLGGDSYSIADIAMYPWAAYLPRHGFDPAAHPRLTAWRETIDARPAAKRAAGTMAEMAAGLAVVPTNEQFDRFFARSKPGPAMDLEGYFALGPMITAQPD